ncbi:copper resistance CopC/CopD family protein [Natrialba asiatica]|uniref:Copper resistance protein CopC n=1 Tax=Natrialba asiatica (strain ATCC 700177 / DSM 12278 / JCM 9576 / FERM P-10747 / NBRC 102637 / 172P1) TaxID=29540 RepID=M0AWK9_NATA1|nr:copper resistance protein CopC [Natrialba asiatica]ELZ03041.1 copper resistance protein CopC [Natrialba asiatica DSM 12278]
MSADESLECDRRSRLRPAWRFVALAVAAFVLTSFATPVAAHAYLSDSNPANGERIDSVPDEITLSFSGDGVQVADATVTGPDGADVSGAAEIDADDSQLVRVPIESSADEDDAEGLYSVEWEILADDGHTVSGSFVFSVGDDPLDRDAVLAAHEDEGPDEEVSPVAAGAKGLLLVALVGLIGGPITAVVAVYPAVSRVEPSARSLRTVDRRLGQCFALTGAVLFGSVLALGLVRATSIGSLSFETMGQFLATPLGREWLVQVGLTALLGAILVGGITGRLPRRGWLAGTAVGAAFVGATVGWTSHSATAIDRLQGAAVDIAHLVGAGLWVGGLVVLALVVPAALREAKPADRSNLAARVIRRYSLLALVGVTLAGATGLVLASWHVPSLAALADSLYGLSLSAKSLLVLLALGLGGLTRFVLLSRLAENSSREFSAAATAADTGTDTATVATFVRAVRFEVAVLVAVLLISGLLTSAPTAAVVGDGAGDSELATIEREVTDDIALELRAGPAADGATATAGETGDSDRSNGRQLVVRPGDPIVFDVAFASSATAGGARIDSDGPVRLLATATEGDRTINVALEETADGTYATVQTLPVEGDWEVRLTGSPNDEFVSETYHVRVETVETDGAHADHDGGAAGSPLSLFLQFGAVAIAVVGSVAVAVEATRFRDRV